MRERHVNIYNRIEENWMKKKKKEKNGLRGSIENYKNIYKYKISHGVDCLLL